MYDLARIARVSVLVLVVACAAPPPDIKFGVSTEQDLRMALRGADMSKVMMPDGSFTLHVWIAAVNHYAIYLFDERGVLQGMAPVATRR